MKKIIGIAVMSMFYLTSYSQSSDNSKVSLGILAGVNFQNLNGEDSEGDKLSNEMLVGFHAGLNAQIPIAPEFYFQPGVLFSTKGAKDSGTGYKSQLNLSYLEIPLEFMYKGSIGNGYVMVGIGPYFGFGITGKYKLETNSATLESNIEFSKSVDDSSSPDKYYLKSFDAGGNIFAGYEMESGLFFRLNTQLGMVNISPENNLTGSKGQAVVKNTGFGLSIGYRFG